jgi:phage shock protein PspC (stress-responsive transcriptional regulator)/FtsH-binding integral membrane protein
MTTTDEFGGNTTPPPPPPPTNPIPPQRVLRRSSTDRVGAGVAGGLGEYFNVDPVLFRVLFATGAFFGGAGLLAYLIAWAAIPEQGTVNAPIDRFVGALRRRRVPVWLVAIVGGLILWGTAFSWWAPHPFFPIIVVVIVLVAIFGRRGRAAGDWRQPPADGQSPAGEAASGPVSLEKDATGAPAAGAERPAWVAETRSWIAEAKQASRERRRRALPVRLSTLGVLVVTLGILAAVDAVTGIALPVYFWVTLGIVVGGLLVGMVTRRTPWSLATLLVPTVVGLIGFGGTHASLHDGFGQKEWTPTSASAVKSDYRLAFGQEVLDLRHVGTFDAPRTVDITLAAGQVRVLAPSTMNLTVNADVHIGVIEVDGQTIVESSGFHDHRSGGFNIDRTILPPSGATGEAVTVNVHLADGNVSVERS